LDDAVSTYHATVFRVVRRAVERMRDCPHEHRGRIRRQHGIGVDGDDVPDAANDLGVADNGGKRLVVVAAHVAIELGQLAALAFPAHPHALAGVPSSGAVEEVENVVGAAGVSRVERTHTVRRYCDDLVVSVAGFGRRVGEVAQDGEMHVWATVGEVLRLEVLERLAYAVDSVEDHRNDDGGTEVRRNSAMAPKLELWQCARWQESGHELIDETDRDLARRNERNQAHDRPRGARRRAGRPKHCGDHARRAGQNAADEDHVRVREHPAMHAFGGGRPIPRPLLQLGAALVYEIVPDVCATRVPPRVAAGGSCKLHRLARDVVLGESRQLRDTLDNVAVPVTRRECHARVIAGWILP
jgi:hypothetical protein